MGEAFVMAQYPQLVEIQEYCMEKSKEEEGCVGCKFNKGSKGKISCRLGASPCWWILDEKERNQDE